MPRREGLELDTTDRLVTTLTTEVGDGRRLRSPSQAPPPESARADFLYAAFSPASRLGLCTRRWGASSGDGSDTALVVTEQPELLLQPRNLSFPAFPAEAAAFPRAYHLGSP